MQQKSTEWPTFNEWLIAVCLAAEIKYSDLHWLLARVNYRCDSTTPRNWLTNVSRPPAEAVPYILRAISTLDIDFDVYKEYDNYLHQRDSELDVRQPYPPQTTPDLTLVA